MLYHIYSDESNTTTGDIMIIGGMIFPSDQEKSIIQGITDKASSMGLFHEIAWGSLSNSNLDRYFELFRYIFKAIDEGKLCLKMIVVDKTKYDNKRYNNLKENPFYKMYFELIYHKFCKKWHKKNNDSLFKMFPDEKSSNQSLLDLKAYLNNYIDMYLGVKGLVLEINPQVSKESIIIQVVDLIIGCFASYANGHYRKNGASKAKRMFIELVQDFFKTENICADTSINSHRFEIWNIRFRNPKK